MIVERRDAVQRQRTHELQRQASLRSNNGGGGDLLDLADIFGGWHDTTQGNVRWYLDPYNYLLIPIPDDSHDEDVPLTPIDISSIKFHDVFSRSVFHTFLFKDEMIRKKYFYYLEKFSDVKYLDIFFFKI